MAADLARLAAAFSWGQDSSPEDDGGGQGNGRAADVGAVVVAGFQDAASPSSGKRASRFCDACDPASCGHGLASCGGGGVGARRNALLDQHLTDFVAVIPLIPHHRGSRRQVLAHPIRTSEVTALPLRRWSCRGPPLLSQTPWSLLVIPPWCHQPGGDHPPCWGWTPWDGL